MKTVEKLTKEEVKMLVKYALTSSVNMARLLLKYGKFAAFCIDHGQLHLDFDNRSNSSWNDDLINLFPLKHPVTMTSWKGIIYVHSLDDPTVDCNCQGTCEILEKIVELYADETEARELLNRYKNER
jgi:hypothetical protein